MKAMLLAAGFGTRFRPITYTIPKPMLPLCNRPLIAYAIDALIAAGVDDIIVNLHHRPGIIEQFVSREYGGRCRVSFSHEEEILGTGGGIRRVRPFFEGEPSFFIMNGDTIQWPPVRKAVEELEKAGALASLVLRHPPEHDRFTPVFFADGFVRGIGTGEGEPLMFSGSHAMSSRIFDRLPDRDFSGITEDVYVPVLQSGSERLAAVVDDGLWFDIGTPQRYVDAMVALLLETIAGRMEVARGSEVDRENAVIADRSASLRGSCRRAVIGASSIVGVNSTVESSTLWDGVEVGDGAVVVGSVIASGVSLPAGAEVRGAIVCRREGVFEIPANGVAIGNLIAVAISPEKPMCAKL